MRNAILEEGSGESIAIYRRAVLIYNPRAGRFARGGEQVLLRAVEVLRAAGHGVELRPTTGARAATEMARSAAAEGVDAVIVAGGDGTINEAVEGLAGSPVPLGILPGGTANVLAVETGLGTGMRRAARMLGECVPRRISLGRVTAADGETRHFLLMAGAGLDAHIVYHMDPALKSRAGKLAYWVGGFRLVGRKLPEFTAETESGVYSCSFALISKVRNYGGDLQIAREVSLLDDCFEVVLFAGSSSFRYLRYLAGVATRRLRGVEGVTVLRADTVRLSAPADSPIYLQIDGEAVGRLPARVDVVPDALTIILPASYGRARGSTQ